MRILFCTDYWNPLYPDSAYEAEAAVVEKVQLTSSLINFEALVEQQNISRAVRKVEPASTQELAIYRGWMLKPHIYEHLYAALAERGLLLMNTPAAYTHCPYLIMRGVRIWALLVCRKTSHLRELERPAWLVYFSRRSPTTV